MRSFDESDIVISGLGVTSAIGQGRDEFTSALLEGRSNFRVMERPGRQRPLTAPDNPTADACPSAFLGAEIGSLRMPARISKGTLRTASLTAQVALTTLDEAWSDARLQDTDPQRIGLIIGGSNFQQRELLQLQTSCGDRPQFLRPTYAMSFMDTDVCGWCTAEFPIRSFAFTLGGASASGQAAVVQALHAVRSGQVDICIAVGALMDLSHWECQALRTLGAMGSDRYATQPQLACRPFDRDRDGFIFGESCGIVVVEHSASAARRDVEPYARVAGWALSMDGNRNPNPSVAGEIRVIGESLQQAGLHARDIDYVNPHGTGSAIGDEIELEALHACGLAHAPLNATKAITGHGLTAAGNVELVATLLQMRARRLHPTLNLDQPMAPERQWVGPDSVAHDIRNALKLSFGFGGINTALCLQRL